MKRLFLYSGLALLLSYTPITEIMAQLSTENLKLKGILSTNTENENNEPDAVFKGLITPAAFQRQLSQRGNKKHVSELENGLQIIKDIINKMIEKEYRFSLLHQHKYMIDNCLGLKVSAGEFDLRFSNPVIEINQVGKIKIKLEVDRINLSALKVRMRPRSPDLSDPNPCHFSGKFEIGGEVTNLTMKAEINPVAQALTGAPGFCFFAFSEDPLIKWNIGGLNLKPLQNNLDAVGKDMIEDALNSGMSHLFYTRFVEVSRAILPEYFSGCEQAYAANKDIISAIPGAMSEESESRDKNSVNKTSKWVITSVPNMKGVLGKLNTKFPEGVDWSIDVRTAAENKFIINRSSYSKHGPLQDIAPGTYNFQLNTVLVENVPIEKGKETRLKAGFLNIVSEGVWQLYDETKKIFLTSDNKPKKMALPVGSYQLNLGGQFFPVVIKDLETVEL